MSLASMYNQKLSTGKTANTSSLPGIVPFPEGIPQSVKTNEAIIKDARNTFISNVLQRVSVFADLDQRIVASDMVKFGSLSDDDRRVYFKRLVFGLTYFSIIEAYIVSVPTFRRFFIDVIKQEIRMDTLPASEVSKIRKSLHVAKYDADDTYYIYGKQLTTAEAYQIFSRTLNDSYDWLGEGEKDMLADAKKLSAADRRELGLVCSHFGYVLRAMALNDKFMLACASAIDHFIETNDR